MKRQIKTSFGKTKSGEVISKLKGRGFRATSLSTKGFSTLYNKLPHNRIKKTSRFDRVDLQKSIKTMVHFIWPVMTDKLLSLPLIKVDIHFGNVRMYAMPYPISRIIFILDSDSSYKDKLLEFGWVQIAPLS